MIRALILALVLAAPVAAQESATLTPGEMQAAAVNALATGDLGLAETFARILLQRDPADPTALAILSRLALEAGVSDEAQSFGAALFRASNPGTARFDAARLTALAAARQGRWIAAMFWLRRAAFHAQTAEEQAQLADDARALREASPISLTLDVGLAPSANLNGGATERFYPVPGSPFQELVQPIDRALSGWSGQVDAGLSWRLREADVSRTTARLRIYARGVILSEEAEALIRTETRPGDARVTAADLSTALAEVELTHAFALNRGLGQVGLSFSRVVTGGDSFYSTAGLEFRRRWVLEGDRTLDLTTARDWRDYDGTRPSETRDILSARYGMPVGDGSFLSFGLTASQTEVGNPILRNQGAGLSVSYSHGALIGPAQISLSAGYDFTDYPDFRSLVIIPGGRQDHRLSASLQAAFPGQAVAGFMPVITLGWQDTDSNIPRYDTDSLSLDLSLRSTF